VLCVLNDRDDCQIFLNFPVPALNLIFHIVVEIFSLAEPYANLYKRINLHVVAVIAEVAVLFKAILEVLEL